VGSSVYVGLGSRTNREGIRQLSELVAPRGYQVIAVPISKVLHLKSGVTALPDGTVVGYPPMVDGPQTYPAFLPVPEEHGTAVVDLGEDTVLMSADGPRTAELFRDPRAQGGHRGDHGIREARGLRDLSFGAAEVGPRVYRWANCSQVSTTVSGLSDMVSMPCSNNHSARSG